MVKFSVGKALGNYQWLHSLEDEFLVFSGINTTEFNSRRENQDHDGDDCGADESEDELNDLLERASYWESQAELLQEVLDHQRLTGSKLRREVSKGLEMMRETDTCRCNPTQNNVECGTCLRRALVDYLWDCGFDAALCTSRWKSTRNCPGGSHNYVDVICKGPGKKLETRYFIELDFRSEFEMAKACQQYQKLIAYLPEVYVGRLEHLTAVTSIMCNAAKRSTKDKKLYMGPWRKTSFMQMKWSGPYQRIPAVESSDDKDSSVQVQVPTFGFLPSFPQVATVEVT